MPDFFLDTCIILAYAYPHDDWNAKCTQFFNANYQRYTGKRVKSELENRLRKRQELYKDLASYLGGGGKPEEFIASVQMNNNDRRHFENLLGQFKAGAIADLLTYLRDKDRVTRKGISEAFSKIRNPLVDNSCDTTCEDIFYTLIANRVDSQILVDALLWSEKRGSATFLTLDLTDFINHRGELMKAVCSYKLIDKSPLDIHHISEVK